MNWKPTDDFAIRFSDETAEDRDEAQLDMMVERMRDVARDYGFDISNWGGWEGMRQVAVSEADGMKRWADVPLGQVRR